MRHIPQRLIERLSRFTPGGRDRAGATDTKTVVIIVLAVAGGLSLLGCGVLALLLVPAISQARNAARLTQSRNNLRQIGLSLLNYESVHRSFPPGGVYAQDGTPHHGWMTQILPFMEQSLVYDRIDFNRPWTDPVNVPLFQNEIPQYLSALEEANRTASGGAASHYAGNAGVLYQNSSVTFREVSDGLSNTLLAGEVGAGYKAWGDPSNVRDPGAGILSDSTSFGRPAGAPPGCTMLLMDGSARDVSTDIDPAILKALSTADGGETIPAF